ncbi:putative polyglutamate biosynthesis protein [Phialemonium atrogriseum]|uniref:Polyglutamate biosynthesis protein n=1 Tax=Phialemonium atrogriseum TaxID=1093897 RepID=A0AAJ0FJ22_9PEZI|nr:putative polyglutamate biosynthesis protein [Phialemonium atrogriseum]KAK1763904.1 putative polyglutamate biosynthesis protein [Phialemonium atrogriseum]
MSPPRQFLINFVGDVMLGRLVDQLFPTHVLEPSEASIVATLLTRHPSLRDYGPEHPWGSTLRLFHSSDVNLINLETAATTHAVKWRNKAFNFRMHPANVAALSAAHVDFANLANNHVLDFHEEGMYETVTTLRNAGISFAGAGESAEEGMRPAVLEIPRDRRTSSGRSSGETDRGPLLRIFSASDHPVSWSSVPAFRLIDYSEPTRNHLRDTILPQTRHQTADEPSPATLNVFSVHWGPNYSWSPAPLIRSLAHFLIDECGIDIIHGHSAHHIQGVEIYKGKLILYGCGDFVDDYAVSPGYRNDLGAVWRVTATEDAEGMAKGSLGLKTLEVFPTRNLLFQAGLMRPDEEGHQWVRSTLMRLCGELGTEVASELGDEGQLVIDIEGHKSHTH